jgi:hypothetical protein
MHSTNYRNAFIEVSADSQATTGLVPSKAGSIAALQLHLLLGRPYELTSDDLLFEVHALRNDIQPSERAAARDTFFVTPKACLRTSPLVKQFGWGIHHDHLGRIAAYAINSDKYREMCSNSDVELVAGMRNKRA